MAAETHDFTKAFEPPSFKIDGDVFYGRKKLNGGAAMKFAQMTESLDDDKEPELEEIALMLKRMFRLTLRTSSYKRMAVRIDATLGAASQEILNDLDVDALTTNDEDDDELDDEILDIVQINEIAEWLLGEYGLRPTEPAASSSTGQANQEDGTNLTVTQ